jgi:hypothetical protein
MTIATQPAKRSRTSLKLDFFSIISNRFGIQCRISMRCKQEADHQPGIVNFFD